MLASRQEKILQLLSQNGYMEVTDLAGLLHVSVATIRRDLDFLEKEGKCVRKHGGCMGVNRSFMFEVPYGEKEQNFIDEKQALAEAAFHYINPGDAVILDSGSTVFQLAYLLPKLENLTVLTNDIKTAVVLASNSKINLFVPGGSVSPDIYTITGTKTVEWFEHIHVNTLFLGAEAIRNDGRIMNFNVNETHAKQAMIKAADKVILLATSDKFSKNGFMEVCSLKAVDVLITDNKIRSETLQWLRQFNLEIKIADSQVYRFPS